MAGYDAYTLAERIRTAMRDETRDTSFKDLLEVELGSEDTPDIVFQSSGPSDTEPKLAIDIVEATRTPEFGEGVDDYQYTVYCTVSRSIQEEAALAPSRHIRRDPDDPNDIVQGSQQRCAKTMRAVERFFATQLQPTDGFVLLSIESIVSGSFADDGTTRALSTLQMQIVLTE